jgi:hypothetical protein
LLDLICISFDFVQSRDEQADENDDNAHYRQQLYDGKTRFFVRYVDVCLHFSVLSHFADFL